MATKVYEGMFLLDSNRYARDPGGVSGQITQIVEKCGGEILASRLWNEQKLAYTIEGHRKGTYWLTYFRLDSGKQGELTRACRLNENILRNLVIRIDDRLVDTLVRHATALRQLRRRPALRRRPRRGSRDRVDARGDVEQDAPAAATAARTTAADIRPRPRNRGRPQQAEQECGEFGEILNSPGSHRCGVDRVGPGGV